MPLVCSTDTAVPRASSGAGEKARMGVAVRRRWSGGEGVVLVLPVWSSGTMVTWAMSSSEIAVTTGLTLGAGIAPFGPEDQEIRRNIEERKRKGRKERRELG